MRAPDRTLQLPPVSHAELATVLAALRYYQSKNQGDPAHRCDWIHGIATANDEVISLDADAIDELCEYLNFESVNKEKKRGTTKQKRKATAKG